MFTIPDDRPLCEFKRGKARVSRSMPQGATLGQRHYSFWEAHLGEEGLSYVYVIRGGSQRQGRSGRDSGRGKARPSWRCKARAGPEAVAVRAAKACADPTCPELQPCPQHQRKPWAGSQRRDRLRKRSGRREQKLARAAMLRDEGRCHVCGEFGANEVDHVIPLAEGGADDLDNRAPIHSAPCHRDKTQREAMRARA